MATQTIHGYSAASTIDAVNDYLLIDPASSGNYNKINRNVLLGITSQPLGLTDSQSPTNKTFNNTNAYTIKDGSLTLQNTADTSKQAVFSLTGITTGTTRTYTLPNATDTLAGIAATQTLTNKTLTSPTITGGTIDNTAITVDSISGHTSATIVTVGGVQMNNGTIGTSGAVTATSIAAGAVQPQGLVTGTGTGWTWQSYTPTWTGSGGNPAIGNGTINGYYMQTGKTIDFYIKVVAGSTTTFGTGTYAFSLPVAGVTTYSFAPLGTFMANHVATSAAYLGIIFTSSPSTSCNIRITSDFSLVTSTAPVTWAQGDTLSLTGSYQVP